MVRISPKVVFKPRVTRGWCHGEVEEAKGEDEGGKVVEIERGDEDVREVVEMLHGVHGHAREGFGVCIAVVERVHVFVDRPEVNEPVC